MKNYAFLVALSLTLLPAAFALDSTVTLKNVHLCCKSCVKGAQHAVEKIEGLTMKADQDSESVTLTSSDKTKLQEAVNALAAGGYFGTSDNSDIKPMAKAGAKGEKVHLLDVSGVHLCCNGCVKAVDRALKNTPGATEHTAKKNAESFQVKGEFNDQKFVEALHQEGLNGKVSKASQ